MIITRISEGLGNQMFQYAAARRLAHWRETELKLDLITYYPYNRRPFRSGEQRFSVRAYALDAFRIAATPATPREIERFRRVPRRGLLERWERLRERVRPARRERHLIEQPGRFEATILNAPADCYLEGFWQSADYFADAAEVVRADFVFKAEPSPAGVRRLAQIDGCPSVSLHVRRGDKAWRPKVKEAHGVLSLDYYARAVAAVAARVPDPCFFVFSDDLDWARDNLRLSLPAFFIGDNAGQPDYEDLRLMSACKHHIVANSSFSWWGAWLRPRPESVVLAPTWWVNDRRLQNPRLLPAHWELIAPAGS